MKGACAAAAEAVRVLAESPFAGEVVIVAIGLHEAPGGRGEDLKHLLASGFKADLAVVCELSGHDVAVAHMGQVTAEITIIRPGTPTHELQTPKGTPHPLHAAGRVLEAIAARNEELAAVEHPWVGAETYFVGEVHGGDFYNRFPTTCRIVGTRRWAPGQHARGGREEYRDLLHGVADETGCDIDLELKPRPRRVRDRPEHPLVRALQASYRDVTGNGLEPIGVKVVADGALFAAAGIPAVYHGPMGSGAHADVEYVAVDELVRAAEVYVGLLRRLLVSHRVDAVARARRAVAEAARGRRPSRGGHAAARRRGGRAGGGAAGVRADARPPELREAIAGAAELGTVDPDRNVLVTLGGMQALYLAAQRVRSAGGRHAPSFFFPQVVDATGGVAHGRLRTGTSSRRDRGRHDARDRQHARQPDGLRLPRRRPRRDRGGARAAACTAAVGRGVRGLIYDGLGHLSPASHPELAGRTLIIRSFSKTHAMAAWRVGYTVGPERAIDAMARVFGWQALAIDGVAQAAALAALTGPQDWIEAGVASSPRATAGDRGRQCDRRPARGGARGRGVHVGRGRGRRGRVERAPGARVRHRGAARPPLRCANAASAHPVRRPPRGARGAARAARQGRRHRLDTRP